MLNRAALVVCLQQPFVDWINAADPADKPRPITLEEANDEGTVYLLEVEGQDELDRWLRRNHAALFENELNAWYTDPGLWPSDRSLAQFRRWCSLELHTIVHDTGRAPLIDDEA